MYFPGRFETKQAPLMMNRALREIEATSGRIEVAHSASDIDRITAAGKIASVLDVQVAIDLDRGRRLATTFQQFVPQRNTYNPFRSQ